MTITLHCLDCGFRLSLTVTSPETSNPTDSRLSCGQCGSRRWASV